jgi:imidazolonepropionase-like amidohydrolase
MKITTVLLVVLSCIGVFAQTAPELGIREKTPRQIAFVNARIVVSPEQTVKRGTLVIKDGLVKAVGSSVEPPEQAIVIDVNGKTIYPGFIDPISEYGLGHVGDLNPRRVGRRPQYESERTGATAWNDALHAEKNWVDYFRPDQEEAERLLKLGFTTVQSAKLDGILRGRSFVALLGDKEPNVLVLKPYGYQFASFDKGSSKQEYPTSMMGAIALLRQSFLDVDWYHAARETFERNPHQEMPEFNAAIAALGDYGKGRFIFETNDELTLLRADRIAKEFSFEFIHVGSNQEYARLDLIKAINPTIILPLDYPETPTVKTIDDELDVSLAELRQWERAPYNPSVLKENDIPFAFTLHRLKDKDDFHKNLRKAVSFGLSEATALAALTTVPAEICGVSDLTGTLEPGKLANFFICDGDIFREDIDIFSAWSAGDVTEFTPLDQPDFRGTYSLSMMDTTLTLEISGELSRLRGKATLGETAIRLKDVKSDRDRLSFVMPLDSLGTNAHARFSGRFHGDTLVGYFDIPTEGRRRWTAARTAEYEREKDVWEGKEGEPVSRLTYPNLAFGFEQLPERQDVLLKNATVWTAEEAGILENHDILVKNGKFEAVDTGLTAGKGVLVIDLNGKHVTPGLIDEHSHVAIAGDVNEGSHAVTSEVRIGDVVDPDDINIYRALAGGTTMLRSLHGSANPIGGQAQIIKLRWGAPPEEMKFADAPPSIKFALGENVKQSNWGEEFTTRYPQSRMGVESIIRDAFQAALEYEADWRRFNNLRLSDRQRTVPPRKDLQLEPLLDVIRSRMFITCHSYVQTEVLMLMRLAEDFGFRVAAFTHILEGYKVADEMAAHGAGAGSFSDWWAYKFEVYDAIAYNTCILTERGVVTAVNSDSPELGRRLNQEAAKSVLYCGMDPHEALKMVTINPAILLKADDKVGSIKAGKDADFVIWNGNPMSVYSHPEQTWIDGRKYFDIERDREMRHDMELERAGLIEKALELKPRRKWNGDWDQWDRSEPKPSGRETEGVGANDVSVERSSR